MLPSPVGDEQAELRDLASEQAALRRVAELVARGAAPEEVFELVTLETSRRLDGAPASLMRCDGEGLAVVVAECHGPAALGLAASVSVPVMVEGLLWGHLSVASSGDALPTGTEERLAHFGDLVGTAIANAVTKAQLTASRARVIATGDEARRRLQRDVHDGAQQRLVQTVITLKLAKAALGDGADGRVTELVDEALLHAQRAMAELRDLVHGILPASLSRDGLHAGVSSLVADLHLPVEVDVATPRLHPATETTAYFVIAEALTNVVKHAHATRAHVRARVEAGVLEVGVRDDGDGGADPHRGSGLMALSDRVAAAEGTLTIASPRGEGTVIAASLPLTVAA